MTMIRLILSCSVLAVPVAAQGLCSGSLSLGGNGAHVAIPTHADLQPATAVTYEAWFNATAVQGRIVSKGDGISSNSDRTFDLSYQPSGKVSAEFFLQTPTGRVYISVEAPTATPLNTWAHVAATFDSVKAEATLFLDGNQVAKKATPTGAGLYQSTRPLVIGGTPPFNNQWFQGQINQVRVWNLAWTAAQTALRFIESPTLPGTTAAWPLDGHLFDLARGHDGQARGTIGWVGGCATFTNYHAGTSGPFGVPSLTSDKPAIGTTMSVKTDNASKAAASGVLAVGLKPIDVPLLGGRLLADPLILLTLPIGATGAQWPFPIPNQQALIGIPLFAQLAVFYPSQTQPGLSAGLQWMIGT